MPVPRLKSPPDDILRGFMAQGWNTVEIAKACGINQKAAWDHVQRIKRMDDIANAAKQPEVTERAVNRVFNFAEQMEHQYERVERYIKQSESNGIDPVTLAPLLTRAESLLNSARTALKELYEIQQIQAWQKTVIETIGQESPELRERVMLRLKQQRSVANAFLPPSNS